MPKWLPSTFSAMPSKAIGTTPSLQENKRRRDAIISYRILSPDEYRAADVHRVACIDHEIEEGNFDLSLVDEGRPEIGGELGPQLHSAAEGARQHLGHAAHGGIEVDRL